MMYQNPDLGERIGMSIFLVAFLISTLSLIAGSINPEFNTSPQYQENHYELLSPRH